MNDGGPESGGQAGTSPHSSDDVVSLTLGDRRVVLVGTAHISQESVDLVREVIARERPDAVCVELDQRRFEVLSQGKRWDALDLREVIKNRQLTTLLLNLILSAYQKKLGAKLGVVPGSEMIEAIRAAEAAGAPVVLCDRDVRATLRRAWGSLSLRKKAMLLSGILASIGDGPEIDEDELRRLRQKDVLSELMQELGRAVPELKRTLIDERDSYLAEKIRRAPGNTVVAVVGAGHIAGMSEALRTAQEVDLEELERIPPPSRLFTAIAWVFAVVMVASIAYVGSTQGAAAARDNVLFWCLATGVPSAVGSALALAHPLTILAALFSAPITALTPVLGVGYVTAFVQCYVVPPRVFEFQTVSEQLSNVTAWWRSRLLRVFLVFIFSSLGGTAGTLVGGTRLLSNLFS